ncbi:MAG: tetratricopeptide repeat protein [Rubrivivax sp.]
MSEHRRWRRALAAALVLSGICAAPVHGQPLADAVVQNSALDAPLFYQLLIGELELRQGQASNAFEIILDAAQRTRDEQLFRRAVDIALHARSGDQALHAVRGWRQAAPKSLDALRAQLQILSALNRVDDLTEPLKALLALTPEGERAALVSAMPRFLQRAPDRRQAARLLDGVLEPARRVEATRVAALVASGRAWLAADDADLALARAREAAAQDDSAVGPALLAIELMPRRPAAEELVRAQLQRSGTDPALRLAYVRALMSAQRYVDASAQLERVTTERPELPQPFLTLGALQLEMRHPKEAESALQRYLQLTDDGAGQRTASVADDDDDGEGDARPDQGRVQAWLMLAQAAEQRGDFGAAESWLARIDDPRRALDVQTRRATLLARQGRVAEAREVVRRTPERDGGDARAKLVAEASVLREVKRWGDAYEVLGGAAQRFPEDADLLYEQAMVAEKLDRVDDMERLLRRVIEMKPDNAHAHNALGYSLADRAQRLPEARALVQRALEISPGDPFITDSLGWVEFRMGNLDEALRLLRQAYASRPDVEIGAHLGEVLWARGDRDEARRIWSESQRRDAANDVLRETLARLKVQL